MTIIIGGIVRGTGSEYVFRVRCADQDKLKLVKEILRKELQERKIKVEMELGWCEK